MQSPPDDTPLRDSTAAASPLPPPGEKRHIDLHRRRAIISADRIDIRPSRTAIIPPLLGFLLGALAVGVIILGVTSNSIPYWLLAILLLFALIAVPLAGITLVYALFGANIIFDRAKQSGAWQQGFLGMGIGTTELVPFWKIEAVAITEAGTPGGSGGNRTEEFAQWEAVLIKKSGKRLPIAGMTVPRRFSRGGFGPVQEVGAAVAALTDTEVRVEEVAWPDPAAVDSRDEEPQPAEFHPRSRVTRPVPRRRSRPRR
jgi:hypothetical protein